MASITKTIRLLKFSAVMGVLENLLVVLAWGVIYFLSSSFLPVAVIITLVTLSALMVAWQAYKLYQAYFVRQCYKANRVMTLLSSLFKVALVTIALLVSLNVGLGALLGALLMDGLLILIVPPSLGVDIASIVRDWRMPKKGEYLEFFVLLFACVLILGASFLFFYMFIPALSTPPTVLGYVFFGLFGALGLCCSFVFESEQFKAIMLFVENQKTATHSKYIAELGLAVIIPWQAIHVDVVASDDYKKNALKTVEKEFDEYLNSKHCNNKKAISIPK